MILDNSTIIGLILALILTNLANYFQIRKIIFSIAHCDKGGKYSKLIKITQNQSILSKINMKYLFQYTSIHKKQFIFWYRFKLCFVILEFIFTLGFIACVIFRNIAFSNLFITITIAQSFGCFFILAIQFDTNRDTKYDSHRLKKRRNR